MSTDHPYGQRRSIRLPGYDYTQGGAYFVTICTHGGAYLFDDPFLRGIVETAWQQIPQHFDYASHDVFVIMPNHLHGILFLSDPMAVKPKRSRRAPSGSLGAIVGNFKSVSARRINQTRQTPAAPVWQRGYYEHIIRTERALNAIRDYIANNPVRWHLDKYNPQAVGADPMASELWRLLQEETPTNDS